MQLNLADQMITGDRHSEKMAINSVCLVICRTDWILHSHVNSDVTSKI